MKSRKIINGTIMNMSNVKIITSNINKHYGGNSKSEKLHVLKDINLTINEGEFFCLLGPSGCGQNNAAQYSGWLRKTDW